MRSLPTARLAVALLVTLSTFPPASAGAQESTTLDVAGLERPVEILVDQWGISHIYADTEHDLFFAQGWNAARDRLFQLELWRRQATGTVAEILGERELERDIGTRLFKFRRDLNQELSHYHDDGIQIIHAYVDGINAYIAQTEEDPSLLTVEFGLLGITPGYWTPEVVISRHQGLLGNIGTELSMGRRVAAVGAETVKELETFGPGDPKLELDPALDGDALFEDILGLYYAFRGGIDFQPEDIVDPEHQGDEDAFALLETAAAEADRAVAYDVEQDIGSNNWVVDGTRSQSQYPMMANDPHRSQGAPSLRYWVHLVGPGWNVIGGGEPSLPGVSIGHNEYGAWGLTVFSTDGEDLYVYETNPEDPNQYRYRGEWEAMTVLTEEIPVEGWSAPHVAELKYTRHGPVVYEDEERNLAYAVRAAWMEIGGAPYLASLRMDQAETWEEFREACNYSNIPGENMVWAGRDGTIGWQSVGIAPIRRNWSGLVPVPGDGRYEWDGYLPIIAKPHVVDPPEGYFATANNDLIPRDYEYMDAVGFDWSDPYRWMRIVEVLGSGIRFSMADMMRLQTDELSIPARELVPMLEDLSATGRTEDARRRLLDWDYVMDKESIAAAIYDEWESELRGTFRDAVVPEEADMNLSLSKVVELVMIPPGSLGEDPLAARDRMLVSALEDAVQSLTDELGADMSGWQYGQPENHHAYIRHPLGNAVDPEMRSRLEVGPAPRGGYGSTVNQTGNGDNQTSGASFRIIVDTGDWDRSVGMNNPGQSGDIRSPLYDNLFEHWADDDFHPVFYSREKVEAATARRIDLRPGR
ncbi:MAG: penicillin acylase family protein [Longimicrobiales bacterium]|nr:penicillin acylase family protein [Longimicrobiales bacterium]